MLEDGFCGDNKQQISIETVCSGAHERSIIIRGDPETVVRPPFSYRRYRMRTAIQNSPTNEQRLEYASPASF